MNKAAIIKEFEGQAKGLDFSKLEALAPFKALQRTEEWFNQRKYKFTSSCIHKLFVEPRSAEAKKNGELGETAKGYILEKLTEELGGEIPEVNTAATRWGEEHEDEARKAYVKHTGNKLEEVGFIQYSDFFGGSPDNAVLDESSEGNRIGGLELKCPYNSSNHLWHCLIDSYEYFKNNHKDYFWQCKSHILTLDVEWCDFASYDPRLKEMNLFIFRLHRKEEDIKLLKDKIDKGEEHLYKLKKQLGLS